MKKISIKNVKKISKKRIYRWTHFFHYADDEFGRKNNEPSESGMYCWIFPKNISKKFIMNYCSKTRNIEGVPTVNPAGDYFSDSLYIKRKGSRTIASIYWGYDI